MKASLKIKNKTYEVDFSKPLDLSIPLRANQQNPVAWYLDPPDISPVHKGDFIGKVSAGASTNFNNIHFNPHAHGTHTECVGHITHEFRSVNEALKEFFFLARVLTVSPEKRGKDLVITKSQLATHLQPNDVTAVVIRTLPNSQEKLEKKYSHTNWSYLEEDAAAYIRDCGVEHLLIDLPSVDKEKDEGKLLAHKAFWWYPENTRLNATITEMIYVPYEIQDGQYLLNLQIAPFHNDASPSRPVLYQLET